uniref:Uncharacterized protein n=1 Tax=Avena sativa TaxID=4498 RepID=A0ACD5Z8C7_AVESA
MDQGKRAVAWPPTADARKTKKPCCDPPTTTTGGGSTVPDISSLLSSLSVAKRHRPSADDDHHALKRPRRHDALAQLLHARMRELEICRDETDMEEEEDEGASNRIGPRHRDWSSFSQDMLRLICGLLPLADVPRFAAVCRHWSSCAFPVYPADTAPVLLSTVVTGAGSSVRCYHPFLHKMFVVATPPQTRLPQGSRVFSAAADGCLMLRTPRKTIMFAPLLYDGGSVFETPQREDDQGFMCAPPEQHHDDGHRDVFAVYLELGVIKIQSWDRGRWKSLHIGGTYFRMSCNPVMHRGKLYCLGQEGNLGVYDPRKIKWRVLRKPASFGSEFQYKNCYLVESQGELLAALTDNIRMPAIHVLRLDEKKMKWEKMESLGGYSLFTGTTSSILVARPPQSMANKVFLPRFYGRPQVIHAELASSGGHLFFVAKEAMPKNDEDGGAWCYDLESGSHRPFAGASCKNLLQHVWVRLGRAASPASDDLMVIG